MSPKADERPFLEPGKAADVRDRLISGDDAELIAARFQLLADPVRLQMIYALPESARENFRVGQQVDAFIPAKGSDK